MGDWHIYLLYVVAAALIVLSGGAIRMADKPRPKFLVASNLMLIAVAVFAILLSSWWVLLAGFVINILYGEFDRRLRNRRMDSVFERIDERNRQKRSQAREVDESKFDELVETHLHGITPPTELMGLRPGEALQGLRAELVTHIDVFKDIILADRQGREEGRTIGGDFYGRVAREVMFRWFSMRPEIREDGSYLIIPDHLAVEFASHIPRILLNEKMQFICEECDDWCNSVVDASERQGSSLVHADGTTRYTCPAGHVVYEQRYGLRIHRDLPE